MKPTEDQEIAKVQNRIVDLANKAIDEAFDLLEFGTPQQRLQLVTRFGGHMLRSLGSDTDDGLESLRNDFLKLVKESNGAVSQPGRKAGNQDQGGRTRSA